MVGHGTTPLGDAFGIGSRDGLHAGVSGKAILAYLQESEIDCRLATPLPRLTPWTIVDPHELRLRIARISRHEYATSDGERIPGAGRTDRYAALLIRAAQRFAAGGA